MQKVKKQLTAVKLRIILIASMTLLVIAAGVGFWYVREQLSAYASEVSANLASADASSQEVSKLQSLKTEIDNNQVAITRAAKIVADSHYYQYQDQIINDITSYANVAGLKIAGFTFEDTAAEAAGTSAAPAASATPTAGATSIPSGLKSTTATITIAPGNGTYQSLMNFLKSIEQNLTKMNLGGVNLLKNASDKGGDVLPGPITIEVYTR